MITRKQWLKATIGSCLGACLPVLARTQNTHSFPSRSLKMVVPYAAGGTVDLIGRMLANRFGPLLGQTVIVENRAGAGTTIGADAVARSEPDGHTLFLGTNSAFTISPQLMPKLGYDAIQGFAAIGMVTELPNLLLVKPDSPYKSFDDLVQAARKQPGKLSYASYGAGSTAHLSGEAIKSKLGIDLIQVPYKSGAQTVQAVLSGEVSVAYDTVLGSVARVKSGQVRALAVTSAKRYFSLPDVPAMEDLGLAGSEVVAWVGCFVPATTPLPAQKALTNALRKTMADPQTQKEFLNLGVQAQFMEPDATMALVRREYVQFGKLIEKAKIRME